MSTADSPIPPSVGSTPPIVDAPTPSRRGKGFLPICATLVLPGLGQLMAGRVRRGALWFSTAVAINAVGVWCIVSPAHFVWTALLGPLTVILSIAVLVDAYRCGHRARRGFLRRAWLRYAAGLVLLVTASTIGPWGLVNVRAAKYARAEYVEAFVLGNTSAMAPALEPRDRFVVHKRTALHRFDLVVFEHPEIHGTVVFRLVGMPGETIEIVAGDLRVNGEIMPPPSGAGPYVNYPYAGQIERALRDRPGAGTEGNPIRLASDEYFVLGDNSARARDGRLWETALPGCQRGVLSSSAIKGTVTAIYWPPSRWRTFRATVDDLSP